MQPQPGYQPQAYVPQNHYQGADQAQLTPRSAIVPLGQHLLEWQKMERTRTGKGKDMVFIKVKILDSSDKANVGLECAFMQNMQTQPPSIAFNALAKLVFPALGFNVADPAHKAQVDAILAQQKFSQWLLEIETKNTVEGRPMAGRQFVAQLTPGTRTEKTPPGKEPFPFINCVPFGPGLFA
jgi:hypothetical protein